MLATFIAFVVGVAVTAGVAGIVRWIADDSRPHVTLEDFESHDIPAFANAPAPSSSACGGRHGCVEGVVGDGVAIYRYRTLGNARFAATYNDAEYFYRSDRFVIEFDDSVSDEDRYFLIQTFEGSFTSGSD